MIRRALPRVVLALVILAAAPVVAALLAAEVLLVLAGLAAVLGWAVL